MFRKTSSSRHEAFDHSVLRPSDRFIAVFIDKHGSYTVGACEQGGVEMDEYTVPAIKDGPTPTVQVHYISTPLGIPFMGSMAKSEQTISHYFETSHSMNVSSRARQIARRMSEDASVYPPALPTTQDRRDYRHYGAQYFKFETGDEMPNKFVSSDNITDSTIGIKVLDTINGTGHRVRMPPGDLYEEIKARTGRQAIFIGDVIDYFVERNFNEILIIDSACSSFYNSVEGAEISDRRTRYARNAFKKRRSQSLGGRRKTRRQKKTV